MFFYSLNERSLIKHSKHTYKGYVGHLGILGLIIDSYKTFFGHIKTPSIELIYFNEDSEYELDGILRVKSEDIVQIHTSLMVTCLYKNEICSFEYIKENSTLVGLVDSELTHLLN